MVPAGAGRWTKELSLPPGLYEYQYVVDGRWVNDPRAVRSTPNPYGGRNSVLVVEKNNSVQPTKIECRAQTESMSLQREMRTLMRHKRLKGHRIACKNRKTPGRNKEMKVAVYDTYVTKKNAGTMHFDIVVPEDMAHEKVLEFGKKYLQKVGQEGQQLSAKECAFCHVEQARPAAEQSIENQGFAIVEMEGCPECVRRADS
jgi:hypothetical protein